jgi:APA family basic amino acid/polyamine antiporter
MMPGAGGQYVYIRRAYGKMASFLYGWTVFTVIQTGVIAAVAVAFAKYAGVFFPSLNNVLLEIGTYFKITYSQVLSIGSIVVLTKLNTGGLENGKWLQLIFTGAKLLALFSLIILGLGIGLNSDTFASNFQDIWSAEKTILNEDNTITTINLTGFALIGALGATIINSIFSSDAWNNVTFIAGEIKNPQKNIPRSLFLGTFIVTIIYILANLAYLALLPVNSSPDANDVLGQGIKFAFDDRLGSSAASMIFGNPGVFLMAGLIMISTFGCNNGLILAGSRLFYAMSKDGLFFNKAGSLNKNSVPGVALWIQCIWSSILCLSGKYSDLLVYSTFASLLFYILTIGGLFILRKREPNAERPYKAFGYPFIPGLYILLALGICVDLLIYDSKNAGIGLILVLIGVPVYFFIKRKLD